MNVMTPSLYGRTRALEEEARDLDVENKRKKNFKTNYNVTTPQELRRNIMAEREIDNLTMEQYLALTRGNHAPGVEDTFSRNKNDDAHEHVEWVLDIVILFNIPGVTHDAVMLRVFPITLTGAAKRWVDRLSP
ncbi:hypothetical protein Tco_0608277 [Tanacetum coccineum]